MDQETSDKLTIKETANLFGVSKAWVWSLIQKGELKAHATHQGFLIRGKPSMSYRIDREVALSMKEDRELHPPKRRLKPRKLKTVQE